MAESVKQEALHIIERMPDESSLEDIMYELYFRARVDRGLREAKEGKLIPHDEVRRNLAEWLKSTGQ
jgi:predicted transcriptional regulator